MAATMKRTVGPQATCSRKPARVVCQASPVSQALRAAVTAVTIGSLIAAPAQAAGVKFAGIKDGATVSSPVHLEFTVDGMTVKPAAEGLQPQTGHFHVLLEQGAAPEGEVLPFDATHLHYGKGQTAADVELAPGKHKLTLQFANAVHASYGPQYAQTITVNVK